MASEKEYSIAERYLPYILKILEDTGHSIHDFGNESAIFFNNVMNGFIAPIGIVRIETTYEDVLSELSRYDTLSKKDAFEPE